MNVALRIVERCLWHKTESFLPSSSSPSPALPKSPPTPRFLSCGDGWVSAAVLRQAFAGDEHPPRNTSSCLVIMDPKHSAEVSKHLDKQNQALMGTYRAMSHELHKLQVEEETIMRKLYELMSAEGLLPKIKLLLMLMLLIARKKSNRRKRMWNQPWRTKNGNHKAH
ncbi:uncharacterized protein LOC101773514 isoform X1 [Setaria italica]|uniref:uncharacterized protein LOC101773514 isoform X1 n=1 Tax=Setaria italica TaxID=4555 RepID=UPI000BE599DA|nr:uncharacterized protein LOC101773514 isoform X1 [Setaria italica]